MENAGEVFHFLEDFSKHKPKTIPQELNDYLVYVARTGDPVFQWALVKSLFKEKLLNVITDFYETTPSVDIPPYPNVDPFNYDVMKNSLLERLDSFTSAPFTVQRICELLTCPRKQYNRVDKFMRAIEKNILVVSTREPGPLRHVEPENGEPIVNGSDNNSEYNVDVEMEDMSCKESSGQRENAEPQPGSSDTQISVDDIQARLQAKQDTPMDTQEKSTTQYESVTPPELNVTESTEGQESEQKPKSVPTEAVPSTSENKKSETITPAEAETKMDTEMKSDEPPAKQTMTIPEIKVNDAYIAEEKVTEESKEAPKVEEKEDLEDKCVMDTQQAISEQTTEATESKMISEVSTSSEESSSSSDNTDGNSNSPKNDTEDLIEEKTDKPDIEKNEQTSNTSAAVTEKPPQNLIQSDNYSISDVNSELPQMPATTNKPREVPVENPVETTTEAEESSVEEKTETTTNSETKDS